MVAAKARGGAREREPLVEEVLGVPGSLDGLQLGKAATVDNIQGLVTVAVVDVTT